MVVLSKGRYFARKARTDDDLQRAQALRARAFHCQTSLDQDAFDERCTQILIEDQKTGALVCCFRMMPLNDGCAIPQSYSAQFYELSGLQSFRGKMVEMGRFCIDPDLNDPDILRVAWGAMTAYVDENKVEMLFGCSSFTGVETADYLDVFAVLRDRHLAPKRWLPKIKAPDVFRFAARLTRPPDMTNAMRNMPPLLRTYLMMGGWVSDHAVVDHQMNTLHVFTGLEIAAIPDTRKRLLRAIAGA